MAQESVVPETTLDVGGDPRSLSRNVSLSRLNAKAPEFVPSPRTTQPQAQQQQRSVSVNVVPHVPPPPPRPGLVHMYPASPHFIPIQMPTAHPHHAHHVPMMHHGHYLHHNNSNNNSSQYYGGGYGGEQEVVVGVQKQNHQQQHTADRTKNGDESSLKILNQVEYYFSDLNLATTDHLMRFITKDPEGYVPINVVASFKKIKALTSSHSQLASILRNSTKLVVSEDGKKVKRQHPLTESDMEELQSRIVVAENLPEDHCHQNLMKVFSAVGSVRTIRTCQPQPTNSVSSSVSRSAKSDGMHFSNKLHAFVEYESVELADKAVSELNDEGNWRSGLRVRLFLRRNVGLVHPPSKPTHARGKKGPEGEGNCEEDEATTSCLQSNDKEEPSQQSHAQSHEHTGEEHANEKEGGQKKGRAHNRRKGRGRGQPHHNNRGNHMGASPANIQTNNEQSSVLKQPPGPRMPDGTRGFSMGRGKPIAISISQ